MQLEPFLGRVRAQLASAAALGDERTREIVAALGDTVAPAVRLSLLAAVAEFAAEVTAALLDHPGSPAVAVRIDGDEVAVDLRPAMPENDPAPIRPSDGQPNARISLRLTDALKADIDAAAEREGVSVNTWLARAAGEALRAGASGPPRDTRGRTRRNDHHHVTGWING